ncbi:MAG: rRNA maturation RNase YbeY [Candidatus Omnitrophica bacterium]|nr:rRNA maturation RNase YbeY [Candidatus Omnitrophota bacterium]
MDIQIRNESKTGRLSAGRVKSTARKILQILGCRSAALSILFLDDRGIRLLNRRYLGRNRPTDVMAFGQRNLWQPKHARPFLGDLAISLETAKRQAARYQTSFTEEVYLYLCHGILHLMGYNDRSKQDAATMSRKQQRILRQIGIGRVR